MRAHARERVCARSASASACVPSQERTIILMVCAARPDLEADVALEFVKEHDPQARDRSCLFEDKSPLESAESCRRVAFVILIFLRGLIKGAMEHVQPLHASRFSDLAVYAVRAHVFGHLPRHLLIAATGARPRVKA
eukprot:1108886-Pleurochrysis_carterae.AAC.1